MYIVEERFLTNYLWNMGIDYDGHEGIRTRMPKTKVVVVD